MFYSSYICDMEWKAKISFRSREIFQYSIYDSKGLRTAGVATRNPESFFIIFALLVLAHKIVTRINIKNVSQSFTKAVKNFLIIFHF